MDGHVRRPATSWPMLENISGKLVYLVPPDVRF